MEGKGFKIFIFKIIPKGVISRLFGYITRLRVPGFILQPIIRIYCKKYGVRTYEILYPEGGFKNFNQFFTRRLKEGVHKIDPVENSIVSPVDAVISCFGKINNNKIIQAKGINYTIESLIPSKISREFNDGSFITLYLSPADYHHIHSPVKGKIAGYFRIPGKLFTVQDFMVNGLAGLFSINERVITYIRSERGLIALCNIGAMNVGRISLSYCGEITNKAFRKRREVIYKTEEQPHIEKGDMVATFNLGSTVIALFQKDMIRFEDLEQGESIRLGERIAFFL